MAKLIKAKVVFNKTNGQMNISIPKKKISKLKLNEIKRTKLIRIKI
jgi:hypothetical protein